MNSGESTDFCTEKYSSSVKGTACVKGGYLGDVRIDMFAHTTGDKARDDMDTPDGDALLIWRRPV